MISLDTIRNSYKEGTKKKKKFDFTDRAPDTKRMTKGGSAYDSKTKYGQARNKRASQGTIKTGGEHKQGTNVSKGVREKQKEGYNQTATGRFTQGVIANGMLAGATKAKGTYYDSHDKKRNVSESKSYKAGKIVGDLLSYGTGYAAAGKAIAKVTGKAVTKKVGKEIAEKAGEKVVKEAAKKGVKEASEKATEKAVKKTAEALTKDGAKDIPKVGKAINKVEGKIGEKIAKSKPVQKYAEKHGNKVAKAAGMGRSKDKIAKDIGAKAAEKITQNLIADATVGTALDTAHAKGEGIDIGLNEEYLKYMGTSAAANVVMGAGFEGLSAGAKRILRKHGVKQAAKIMEKEAQSEVNVAKKQRMKKDAERVRNLQNRIKQVGEQDAKAKSEGKPLKDTLSPDEMRMRRNTKQQYRRMTDKSFDRAKKKHYSVTDELGTERNLKKKNNAFKDLSNTREVAHIKPKVTDATRETYLDSFKRARQYADDKGLNMDDVIAEHNGNRSEAIRDLYERSLAEEKQSAKSISPEERAEVKPDETPKQSARDIVKDDKDFETFRDINTQDGIDNVSENIMRMQEKGLDPNDNELFEEELAKLYLEKNGRSVEIPKEKAYNDVGGDVNGKGTGEAGTAGAERPVDGEIQGQRVASVNGENVSQNGNVGRESGRNGRSVLLKPESEKAMRDSGIDVDSIQDVSHDPSYFIAKQTENAQSQKYGACVDPMSPEDAAKSKLIATHNGDITIAVKDDGDICALAKKAGSKADISSAMLAAIENGGNKCDAYGIHLVNTYTKFGLEPVARVPFNADIIRQFTPADKVDDILKMFEELGNPDVYVFMHNGDSVETILKKKNLLPEEGGYKIWTQEELDDLKSFDSKDPYQDALDYRDNLLEERMKSKDMGGFKSTERPQRPTGDSGEVSQAAETIRDSDVQTRESRKKMAQEIVEGGFHKRFKSNKEALAQAEARVNSEGLDVVAKRFKDNVDDGFETTSERIAEAYVCYREYIAKGDYESASELASRLVITESEHGRALQAMRLFSSMTPEGKVNAVLRTLKKINTQRGTDINIPKELLDNLRKAQTDKEINDAKKAISLHIWNNIPANWVEKANAWRYLAMLGNPKTHGRNMIGNMIFAPVRDLRNIIATGAEHAFVHDKSARTKAIINPMSSTDRALKKLGRDSWESGVGDVLRGNSKYFDTGNMSDLARRDPDAKVFKNKFLDALYKLNGRYLDKEDLWFMKPHYENAYAQFLKAKGYTAETATEEILRKAEQYASDEALSATFREFNVVADKLNKAKRHANMKTKDIPSNLDTESLRATDRMVKKAGGLAVEALVPFAKTPTNILKQGIKFSPAEIVIGSGRIAKAMMNNDTEAFVEALTDVSGGIAGTGVFSLGVLMAKNGIATGGLEYTSKEDNYGKMLGDQEYSVTITKNFPLNFSGKDYTMTVDTFAPICIPFFMGVETANGLQGHDAMAILSGMDKITDPVFNLSMLQSLTSAFDNQYSSGNPVAEVARQTAESYVGQYIPTIAGQAARTFQPETTTTTATDEDPNIRNYHRFANQMKNKVPILANSNAPKVNAWGEKETKEDTSDYVKAGLQNFIIPVNVKRKESSFVDDELQSLMNQGADNSVLPSSKPNSYTIKYNGNDLRMNANEYAKMQENTGQQSKKELQNLFMSEKYRDASVEEKQKMITEIYSNAKADAKRKLLYSRGYTKEDVSWNVDLSQKDREKVGTKSDFLKLLKKTKVTPEEFGKFHQNGLSVSDLMDAAEQKVSLKDYQTVKEVGEKYGDGGYAGQAAELYDKGVIKSAKEAEAYDIKGRTYNFAVAYTEAGYTPEEINELTGNVDEVVQYIKDEYTDTGYLSTDALNAYLESRDDLSQQDKRNLWFVYAHKNWNKNPF